VWQSEQSILDTNSAYMRQTTSESETTRTAQISQYDGEPVGACIYLSASDLTALGLSIKHTQELSYTLNSQQQKLEIQQNKVDEA